MLSPRPLPKNKHAVGLQNSDRKVFYSWPVTPKRDGDFQTDKRLTRADNCGIGSVFVTQSTHLNTKKAEAHLPLVNELTLESRGKLRRPVQLQKLIRLLGLSRYSCSIAWAGPTRTQDGVRGARERALEAGLVAFVTHVLQAVRLLDVQARDPGLMKRGRFS